MPKFSLFRKPQKQPKEESPAVPPQEEANVTEEPKQEAPEPKQEEPNQEPAVPAQPEPESVEQPMEPKKEEVTSKTYLKAMPLKELNDVEKIKEEVKSGNIVILRVTPLASKSIEAVKTAVNDLYEFTESVGGDIARLGEERVVICPKNIRIWREKTPVSNESVSTAA